MAVPFKAQSVEEQRGAALVELALILPLLGFMAYGLVHFGLALREKQVIVEAARYGARRAAAESTPICDTGSSRSFSTCQDVLSGSYGNGEDSSDEFATYYACQSIEQAGLDTKLWKVAANTGSEGYATTVQVAIERAVPVQFFVRKLMGDTWPKSQGVFSSAQECGDEE
jgi:Flp pilus assembly protein TadG